MKILPDTSVLVPAIRQNHVNHVRAFAWRERVARGEISGVIAAHSLVETYSTLTKVPAPLRLSPRMAYNAIERVIPDFEIIALTEAEVLAVLRDMASRNISGGSVFDALIVAMARKAEVDLILTYNINHFLRVAPDLAARIQEP